MGNKSGVEQVVEVRWFVTGLIRNRITTWEDANGIHHNYQEDVLGCYFEEKREAIVIDIRILVDADSGKSRGRGFVQLQFRDNNAAKTALNACINDDMLPNTVKAILDKPEAGLTVADKESNGPVNPLSRPASEKKKRIKKSKVPPLRRVDWQVMKSVARRSGRKATNIIEIPGRLIAQAAQRVVIKNTFVEVIYERICGVFGNNFFGPFSSWHFD